MTLLEIIARAMPPATNAVELSHWTECHLRAERDADRPQMWEPSALFETPFKFNGRPVFIVRDIPDATVRFVTALGDFEFRYPR